MAGSGRVLTWRVSEGLRAHAGVGGWPEGACPPACRVQDSGRVRRFRHRGAGDQGPDERRMDSCLRCDQHSVVQAWARLAPHSDAARSLSRPASMARALGIGSRLAYQAARTGELPTIGIGRRVLVLRDAIPELRQQQEMGADPS